MIRESLRRPFLSPMYSHFPETTVLGTILLVILVLMLLGAVPAWPHSRQWGYAPSGLLGTVLIIVLILVLLGRL